MTDLDALLAGCAAAPADDLPRLVLADWLDEHGEEAYGEFIRVQCELAAKERELADLLNEETDWDACTELSARWCPNCGDCACRNPEESLSDPSCPLHDRDSRHCCQADVEERIDALRGRERELLDRHWSEWVRGDGRVPDGWNLSTDGDSFHVWRDEPFDDGIRIWFRRGFIGVVRGPLVALLGERCGRCGGMASVFNDDETDSDCPACVGPDGKPTGRTPGALGRMGVELLLVERCEVSDRTPMRR